MRSRADLLPHGDVGTRERAQSEVAFAGCQAARYLALFVDIGSHWLPALSTSMVWALPIRVAASDSLLAPLRLRR